MADEYNYNTLIRELLTFPDSQHDDCVDALSQGLNELTKSNKVSSGVSKESLLKSSAYSSLF